MFGQFVLSRAASLIYRTAVDKLDVVRTPPDPAWRLHSADVVASTILRDAGISGDDLLAGKEIVGDPPKDFLRASAAGQRSRAS